MSDSVLIVAIVAIVSVIGLMSIVILILYKDNATFNLRGKYGNNAELEMSATTDNKNSKK